MAVIDGNFVTSPIANTTLQEKLRDGVLYAYSIAPVEGYVLHDKELDYPLPDEVTLEETLILGYTRGDCTCEARYDFVANPREFYAVPENDVPDPENQIFGGTGDDHVVA